MADFENTIKRILEESQSLQKGYINGNIVEVNSEIIQNIQILGNVDEGECLVATTTDTNERVAIPTIYIKQRIETDKEVDYFSRRRLRIYGIDEYDYCLIYSYVDLTYDPSSDQTNEDDQEKDTVNSNVYYALRSNRIVTKAPEAPKSMLHLEKVDNSAYGIPLYRHPYYRTRGEAVNIENGRFFTGRVLSFQNYSFGESLIDQNFQADITRTVNYGAEFDLQVTRKSTYNPLVPTPPTLVYEWSLYANLDNILVPPNNARVGEKVLRFKKSDQYEVELLRLHPYEIHKTYINQLDSETFEVVVKAGVKVDHNGFPKNQYNMQEYYNSIQNENYVDFSDHQPEKENEKLEFTYEQLYCLKWCKGFYFKIRKGEIIKENEYTPVDDYKNFDYSVFEQGGRGRYDKVYACSYAGNWDKYDKNGNQLIKKDYYGNNLTYKDYHIFNKAHNLNQEEPFEDEDGKLIKEDQHDGQQNLIAIAPQIISMEYGSMYVPLGETQIRKNTTIHRLYDSATFDIDGNEQSLDIVDSYLDVDYGYDNLNSLEQHILGENNKLNILDDDTVPLIFSNLNNNITIKNSSFDYGVQFFVDYPYAMDIFNFTYTYKEAPVTMDYFPKDVHSKIKKFDSEKKPWDYDYYGGEDDNPQNKDKQAKLEFKLVEKDKIDINNAEVARKENFKIDKFEVTQDDLSNVSERGDLNKEKFHVENIYICKI